jgi:hypothetical protein
VGRVGRSGLSEGLGGSWDSLELGDFVSRAHVPDVDTSCQVAETRGQKQLALRLVEEEVSMLRSERIDGFRFGVEQLHSRGHVYRERTTLPRHSHP